MKVSVSSACLAALLLGGTFSLTSGALFSSALISSASAQDQTTQENAPAQQQSVPAQAGQGVAPPTPTPQQAAQSAIDAEMDKMHWQKAGDYTLPVSGSKLTIPDGYAGIFGPEAQRAMELMNGTPHPETEAVLFNRQNDMVVFSWQPEGYVSSNDWSTIDAGAMLSSISEGTLADNAEREKRNLPLLSVTGWLQQPHFDSGTNTAYWALGLASNGAPLVNSIALRLARQGYEKIIWVTDKEHFAGDNVLQAMLGANEFPLGKRYIDHVAGDKMAGYGIAALVATVAGAKIAKAAGFVGLLVLLKKAWLLPVLAFAALRKKIKGWFGRSGNGGRDA